MIGGKDNGSPFTSDSGASANPAPRKVTPPIIGLQRQVSKGSGNKGEKKKQSTATGSVQANGGGKAVNNNLKTTRS